MLGEPGDKKHKGTLEQYQKTKERPDGIPAWKVSHSCSGTAKQRPGVELSGSSETVEWLGGWALARLRWWARRQGGRNGLQSAVASPCPLHIW